MSSADASESRALRDFFIFDLAKLSRLDLPGLDLIHQLFSLWLPSDGAVARLRGGTMFEKLAAALTLDIRGDHAQARAIYEEMLSVKRVDDMLRLVLLALRAWLGDASDSDELDFAVEIRSPRFDRKVRVAGMCKLVTWRWDRGDFDGAKSMFREARSLARGDQREALNRVAAWFGEEGDFAGRWITSDFVSQPNVVELTSRSATAFVDRLVKSSARNSWQRSSYFETVPQRDARSALLQANWAGALWLIPQVRRHLGAVLLASKEHVPEGIVSWIAGVGGDLAQVTRSHESSFDQSTPQQLWALRHQLGPYLISSSQWHGLFLEIWDELDDVAIADLIQSIPIAPIEWEIDQPHDPGGNALFAVLSVRSAARWRERFADLDDDLVLGVAPYFSPYALMALSDSVLSRVVEVTLDAVATQKQSRSIWRALVDQLQATRRRSDLGNGKVLGRRLRRALRDAPGWALVPALERHDLSGSPWGDRIIDELIGEVTASVERARGGSWTVSDRDARVDLGRAVAASERRSVPAVSSLLDALEAPWSSIEDQQNAIRGLTAIARGIGLTTRVVKRIKQWEWPLSAPTWSDNPDEEARLLLALRLVLLLEVGAITSQDRATLVVAIRDASERVRIAALAGVVRAKEFQSEPYQWSVLSALYDPEPAMRSIAVQAFRHGWLARRDLRDVAVDRLERLWNDAAKVLRVEIALTANTLNLESLVERGVNDRSWEVRDAAQRGFDRDHLTTRGSR